MSLIGCGWYSVMLDRLSVLEMEREEGKRTISEQHSLIEQLETDLVNVQRFLPARTEAEGEASPSGRVDVSKLQSVSVPAVALATSDSLLPIISSQRERFRSRNMELEAETQHNQQVISSLRNEVDSLRSDNVKLYEKIKFLESYPAMVSSYNGYRTAGHWFAVLQSKLSRDDIVGRYSMEYEKKLDPFTAFSKREREKRYMGLSGPEKATLNLVLLSLIF
jgi:homeobox protein cut-like